MVLCFFVYIDVVLFLKCIHVFDVYIDVVFFLNAFIFFYLIGHIIINYLLRTHACTHVQIYTCTHTHTHTRTHAHMYTHTRTHTRTHTHILHSTCCLYSLRLVSTLYFACFSKCLPTTMLHVSSLCFQVGFSSSSRWSIICVLVCAD